MKTLGLLFLTMTWVALTLMSGPGYAASSPASQPTSPPSSANTASGHTGDAGQAASPRDGRYQARRKASDDRRNHAPASDPNHPISRTSLIKANHPKPLPNNRQRSLPGNALNLHQPDKSGGAARSGFIRSVTVNNALPVRMSDVVRPTAPVLNNVRHRSPNPAVVGGSPSVHNGNTGAISGTRMSRKP